jgi:hypothetical protein
MTGEVWQPTIETLVVPFLVGEKVRGIEPVWVLINS